MREFEGRFTVVLLPNITHVFYGRDVGDAVERIDLDQAVQAISASELRKKLSAGSWSMIPKKPAPDLIRL